MEVKLEIEHVNYVETSTFGFLFEDNQFTDVTLVCEDMQQTWVHKVVLSYASELFKDIFMRNSHTQVEGLTASAIDKGKTTRYHEQEDEVKADTPLVPGRHIGVSLGQEDLVTPDTPLVPEGNKRVSIGHEDEVNQILPWDLGDTSVCP